MTIRYLRATMSYHFNSHLVTKSQQDFVTQLLDCNDFEHSDRLLGFSKGRGITWFIATQDKLGVDCVRRHYYRGGLFGKIVKDYYLFQGIDKTRAAQEFHLLQQMAEWGLPTPRPIAYKITRLGFFYQADILLEKINHTQDLSQYLQQTRLNEKECHSIGGLIRRLHDLQIYHSDLNIHNILRQQESGQFYLIDFDKCHIQQGNEWKKANLDRLLRSFNKEKERLKIHFDDQHWQAILAGYTN